MGQRFMAGLHGGVVHAQLGCRGADAVGFHQRAEHVRGTGVETGEGAHVLMRGPRVVGLGEQQHRSEVRRVDGRCGGVRQPERDDRRVPGFGCPVGTHRGPEPDRFRRAELAGDVECGLQEPVPGRHDRGGGRDRAPAPPRYGGAPCRRTVLPSFFFSSLCDDRGPPVGLHRHVTLFSQATAMRGGYGGPGPPFARPGTGASGRLPGPLMSVPGPGRQLAGTRARFAPTTASEPAPRAHASRKEPACR
ncbi:protein of unknown function [Streptomyces murinus]